jgi:transposase
MSEASGLWGEELSKARAADGEAEESAHQEEEGGKPRVKWINRQQLVMRVVDVEKLVGEEHEVRAVWELVGRLDLSSYYEQIAALERSAGRPATDPRLLVSLWLYAYSKGISSGREIERLCAHDPAFQWLTGMEVVNYHTLTSFRSENQAALQQLFVTLLGLLSAEGLITLERVTQDGTKVLACAGKDTFRRAERIREHLQAAQEQVELLAAQSEPEEVTARLAKARQRAAKERQARLELAVAELEKLRGEGARGKKELRVSESDPQARVMKQSDGGFAPSYNVQLSTEVSSGVIVGVGVTQTAVDFDELVSAVERVAENTGQLPEQMIVDAGYTTRSNIIDMDQRGIELIGDPTLGSSGKENSLKHAGIAKEFGRDAFHYDETNDTYTCPVGKLLKLYGKSQREGYVEHQYRAATSDCRACPSKPQCCPQSKCGRTVSQRTEDSVVTSFKTKMQSETMKQSYKLRSQVAEFSIAWIKEKIGLRRFRLRGLTKVTMEALWACIANNVAQWIRLRWRRGCAEPVT